jgi:hypothetical protein
VYGVPRHLASWWPLKLDVPACLYYKTSPEVAIPLIAALDRALLLSLPPPTNTAVETRSPRRYLPSDSPLTSRNAPVLTAAPPAVALVHLSTPCPLLKLKQGITKMWRCCHFYSLAHHPVFLCYTCDTRVTDSRSCTALSSFFVLLEPKLAVELISPRSFRSLRVVAVVPKPSVRMYYGGPRRSFPGSERRRPSIRL